MNPILSLDSGSGGAGDATSRDGGSEDVWTTSGTSDEFQVRVHRRERRELFTPLRVAGSGPARALFSCRITDGVFCASGERFRIVDAWTDRKSAHQSLSKPWTGTTTFVRKSAYEHGSRISVLQAPFSELAAVPVGGSEFSSPSYSLLHRNSYSLSGNRTCTLGNRLCTVVVADNTTTTPLTRCPGKPPRTGSEVPVRSPLRADGQLNCFNIRENEG